MKNVLIDQSSEYDCGPTSMVNAIRFLFDREEIEPGVLKHIWMMGIDTYCEKGHVGKHGTSVASMRYMADWLEAYGKGHQFPVEADFLSENACVLEPGSRPWTWMEKGGCIVMRCHTAEIPHYVLLTGLLENGEVGLYDPYWEEPVFTEPGIRVVEGEPKKMNRAVRYDLINRTDEKQDYAMGPMEKRDMVLVRRRADA